MKKVKKLVPFFDLVFTAMPACDAEVSISVNKPFKGFVNGNLVNFVPGDIVKVSSLSTKSCSEICPSCDGDRPVGGVNDDLLF